MRRSVVKSASRTLELLELFSNERRPLRLIEIYPHLHYPQSSTTNLLKSMVTLGYLNYNRASRTYFPTHRVAQLGNWLFGFAYGHSEYQALLQNIQRRTDETSALVTQNDFFIQYIRILTPAHEFKMPPQEGAMRALTDSSTGLALMSRMSNTEVDKVCRYINYYQLDRHKHVDTGNIMEQLERARRLGYVYLARHPEPETSSIAFPLDQKVHGIPLAIGIGGLQERIAQKKELIIRVLREEVGGFAGTTGPVPDNVPRIADERSDGPAPRS